VDSLLFWLLLLALLLLANGVFVAAEFALVAVRRSRVQELVESGNPAASVVQRLQSDMDTSIAGAQLGITIASIALGWVAENSIHEAIEMLFAHTPGLAGIELPAGIGIAVAFVILTMLHVILGEQVPKSWALRVPEKMALLLAVPFRLFCLLSWPLIYLMNSIAGVILRACGIPQVGSKTHAIRSVEEFAILFRQSARAGALNEEELELLTGSLELRKLTARQLMVPRSEIVWLDGNKPAEELIETVLNSQHSRFPLAAGQLDKVSGIVAAKQLLAAFATGKPLEMDLLSQPILIVPESKSALSILKSFQESRTNIAIVMDEYGAVRGLVTLHDILVAIVGELPEEVEEPAPQVVTLGEGGWLIDGALAIDEFCEIVALKELPVDAEHKYYTLAGFVLSRLQHIPEAGESFEWAHLAFTIVKMERNRIARINVRRLG